LKAFEVLLTYFGIDQYRVREKLIKKNVPKEKVDVLYQKFKEYTTVLKE